MPSAASPESAPSVYLLQMARVFTRTSGSRATIATNFRWMRGLSSIHLILGDTTAGTQALSGEGAEGRAGA